MRKLEYLAIGEVVRVEEWSPVREYPRSVMKDYFFDEPRLRLFSFGENTTYKVSRGIHQKHKRVYEPTPMIEYKPWYGLGFITKYREGNIRWTIELEYEYSCVTIEYDDQSFTFLLEKIDVQ